MATRKKATKRKRNYTAVSHNVGKRKYFYFTKKDGKPSKRFATLDRMDKARLAYLDATLGPRRTPKKNPAKYPKKAAMLKYLGRSADSAIANDLKWLRQVYRDTKMQEHGRAFEAMARAKKKNGSVGAKRKRNGSELNAAAKMFKKFHGKPATGVKTVEQLRVTPSVLADCGKLIELVVATEKGSGVKLSFKGGVRMACTGDGGQLYFVGGDQAQNLRMFPGVSLPKDQVELGEAVSICYHTSKDFHNFEPSDYEHEFGEEGGARPMLCYDVHSRRLYFVGGDYVVKREGIVD